MTWKDKLEIGLKGDAPYRKDNLPDQQVRGTEIPAGKDRSPIIPAAARDVNETSEHGAAGPAPARIPDDDEFSDPSDNDASKP